MINQKIAEIFFKIGNLLEIKGEVFRSRAYRKAAETVKNLEEDISFFYKKEGINGLKKIPGVGKSIAKKIEEYLRKGKIKYCEELEKETAIRQVITHYFETKGLSLNQLKNNVRKKKIIYSRFTRPAKQLIELAGSPESAKEAIDKVAKWANSRNLDYAIETVFKKWLEIDRLKPKEVVKKPFYDNLPMVWSETQKKWFVIDKSGEWLEFAGKESRIEWRIIK